MIKPIPPLAAIVISLLIALAGVIVIVVSYV